MRQHLFTIATAALLLVLPPVAQAQAQAQPTNTPLSVRSELAPSAVAQCLQPLGAVPEFPFDALKQREKGSVKVQFTFTAPDQAPKVEVLERNGDPSFLAAVQQHATRLRTPCLLPGTRAQLVQTFDFVPDSQVVYRSRPRDVADDLRHDLTKCIVHTAGEPTPQYPPLALRDGEHGRIIAKLRFTEPGSAPVAEVYGLRGNDRLKRSASQWVDALRMPCLTGEAVTVMHVYAFRFEGDPMYGFKNLELRQLLPVVVGIREQRLSIDTTTMGCPFDLKFRYHRPFLRNSVAEVGDSNPARGPLMDWLETVALDLPRANLHAVFGDEANLTVSCLKIDLSPKNPQEKS